MSAIPMTERPRGHEWFTAARNGNRKHIVDWSGSDGFILVAACGIAGNADAKSAGDDLWDDILDENTRVMPLCCPDCVKAVTA